MKTQLRLSLQLVLMLTVCIAFAQPHQDTFIGATYTARTNSILLDNEPVNPLFFSTASRGILAVTSRDPETGKIEKIPFRVSLKRNDKIILGGGYNNQRSVTEIDVASVLKGSKPGDMLMIEPTRAEDWGAGRTIRVNDFIFKPLYNLLSFFKKQDGC